MRLYYPKFLDTVPIVVSVTKGIDEDGSQKVIATYTGKCCFTDKVKQVFQKDGKAIQLQAKAMICGDIAPEAPTIEGYAVIFGETYKIYTGSRPRNPDGTVNHTELELM